MLKNKLILLYVVFTLFNYANAQKIRITGNANITTIKGKYIGFGGDIGLMFNKNIGIVGGVESYRIDDLKTNEAIPVFGEIKYFFPLKKSNIFLGLLAGKFNWEYEHVTKVNASDNIYQRALGENMYGIETGFCFSPKNKSNGFFISYSFRNVQFNTITRAVVYNVTYRVEEIKISTTDNYSVFKIGYKF
jgi:hypothetical protein